MSKNSEAFSLITVDASSNDDLVRGKYIQLGELVRYGRIKITTFRFGLSVLVAEIIAAHRAFTFLHSGKDDPVHIQNIQWRVGTQLLLTLTIVLHHRPRCATQCFLH